MASGGRTKAIVCLGLIAATILAYEPIRHNDFVNYDDRAYITENPNVNGGITTRSVVWAFTETYLANWYPLTWLSHMLDFEIYGQNPAGHHTTSVLIHIISSVLLFLVILKMTGSLWPSAFTAAIFALHPVHVESVAWAAERKDVLSGLFRILTLLAYVYYAGKPNFVRYAIVLTAFIIGIMSKPMVVTLPFVLLLLDYWPFDRLKKQKAVWLIIEKIPLLALSAMSCLITLFAQKSGGAVIAIEKIPLDYRIANTFFSYIRYIGKTLWPSRLAVLYPHPHIYPAGAAAIIAGLLLVLLTIFCIDFGRRKKYLITGWFWYVGTLVPVIGLVQVGSQGIADRYMYLPMTGLILVATWGVNDIIAGRPRLKIITAISAGIILLLLLVLTQIQVQYWQNSLTLFEHTLRVTKDNAGAETYYGAALAEAGRFSQAEQHLKNALQINSEAAPAYYHLGMTLAMTGKFDEAVNCFRAVIELDQNYPSIYKRMGMTLLSASKPDEAVEYLRKSLQINPNEAIVYVTLSIAYIKSGEIDLAIETWARAKELEPGIAVGLNNPAWVLVTSGDISAKDANNAIVFAERNCKMTGYNDPGLLDTLAAAYAAAGRFDEALKTAQKAVDAAKKSGREDLADAIRKRMELYKAGHRYRR